MARIELDDMVDAVATAIEKSHAAIDRSIRKKINHYFDKDKDGNLVPHKLRIKKSDAPNDFVDISKFALYSGTSVLHLNEAEIDFKIRASEIYSEKEEGRNKPELYIDLSGGQEEDNSMMKVKLSFKRDHHNEQFSRLIDVCQN